MKREKMAQRAKDLLSMITLDQISYTLLDIPPISYDIFMKMHGKGNSIQRSIQTNDDWMSEEVQTDLILEENKWTQYPIKFSTDEIYLTEKKSEIIQSDNLFQKARSFLDYTKDSHTNIIDGNDITLNNPLRIFLDQRKGCGSDTVLSRKKYDEYFHKAKHFNEKKLKQFIDKAGNLVLKFLDSKIDDKCINEKSRESDWPFSESCQVFLSNGSKPLFYLKNREIKNVLFSENSTSHILTVHSKPASPVENSDLDSLEADFWSKYLICIWETDGKVPRKVLTVCDSVAACVYRGKLDGMVFAALDDGSLCVWDLKERAFWHQKMSKKPQSNQEQIQRISKELTTTMVDREWNQAMLENSLEDDAEYIFRTCTFSSSAACRKTGVKWFGSVVSLVYKGYVGSECGRTGAGDNNTTHSILGQLCVLQEYGYITMWSVYRTKESMKSNVSTVYSNTSAYWSEINLSKSYEINLQTFVPTKESQEMSNDFNLITAKRRNNLKRQSNRSPNDKYKADITDTNNGVASNEKSGRISPCNWECGVVCTDLKILMKRGNDEACLVARNCGEVIGCRKKDGGDHIQRYRVADETNTITTLEVSPSKKSHFLAGTDAGTIVLYSMEESRTLITLNCASKKEKSIERNHLTENIKTTQLKKIWWLGNDECCFLTLSSDGVLRLWDLVKSDIYPIHAVGEKDGLKEANLGSDFGNDCPRLAALTFSGRLEIHKLLSAGPKDLRHDLFVKYAALL